MYSDQQVINQCKQWVDEIIIGLNFCPFAKKEFVQNTIAYPVVRNVDLASALQSLLEECKHLDEHPELETTLVIYPENFQYFYDYLELVNMAENLMVAEGYEGVYQIASFHPDYVFNGVAEDDESNFTNRSPFPILHIIREASMDRAVNAHPDPEGIPDRNIELCYKKGSEFFTQFLLNLKKER
ncbi:DUF1415 domain-containing protein [Thalassotalea fonticola]|uniref:DUF1415 domain-containing protein n=1 Tax=Thalassotalea fonticola TaxID=3065649 RepID=A0ABZ0GRS4_9GAMM|nr:DUF1415 domain-containing protein [Colwelliaceae bacterium S1-1]